MWVKVAAKRNDIHYARIRRYTPAYSRNRLLSAIHHLATRARERVVIATWLPLTIFLHRFFWRFFCLLTLSRRTAVYVYISLWHDGAALFIFGMAFVSHLWHHLYESRAFWYSRSIAPARHGLALCLYCVSRLLFSFGEMTFLNFFLQLLILFFF